MLLKLLKRDLYLHWDVLVVPLGVLALLMGGLSFVNAGVAVFSTLLLTALFIPFLPLALHRREGTQGTLGDLAALPVSRRSLVELRFLEVFLLVATALVLGHLGTWIVECTQAHRLVPMQIMGAHNATPILVLLLGCFAYPLPFLLRWEGKGFVAAYALIFLAGLVVERLPERPKCAIVMGLFRLMENVIQHPGRMALLALALFALSYLASLWAISRREL